MRGKRLAAIALILFIVGGMVGAIAWYVHGHNIAVLQPAGEVGRRERNLILVALLLSVIVVVPVYIMTIGIALKYREGNHKDPKKKVKYEPDWASSRVYEAIWWGIPLVIITILSIITWYTSHSLDPSKPLASNVRPLTIQVVALDWKWLFIYPEQRIATVDYAEFPNNTPVDFEITSDTVMNSFWIPSLGSQIYAMPGMSTQLHLMANKIGSYRGSSANISGSGFAGMVFTARSASSADFSSWVNTVEASPQYLTPTTYKTLAEPTKGYAVQYYASVTDGLYDTIVMKYMSPMPSSKQMTYAQGMDM